jgi:hypothetical protein
MLCTPPKYFLAYHIKKNEMGEACSKYEGKERFIDGFDGNT